jgi:hypothetical protein
MFRTVLAAIVSIAAFVAVGQACSNMHRADCDELASKGRFPIKCGGYGLTEGWASPQAWAARTR